MPYTIKKVKDGYKVCKKDDLSTCFSKEGIPEERAKKQEQAIIISEMKGGAIPSDPELYEKIKEEIYAKNPKHSAYRSMQIVRAYKKAGGEYEDDGKRDTKKWLGQKWTSVNDYYHNGEIIACGNSNTEEKFGEYPLCRPLKIIKELSKSQLKKMIDEKRDKSPLITANVLGTDEFNIKNTATGGLKPLTARVGGKVLLKKKIVDDYFPSPSTYSTYVEPFVGGGSVYFYKNKDNHKEIVNDIDPDIMEIFEGFKKYPASKIAEDVNGDYSKKDFEKILESDPQSEYNRFLRTFLLYRLSFFGRGSSFGKPRINSRFVGYQERLKDTDLYNTDYKEIIKKYNKPNTFFYLDPPARESSGNYRYSSIDIPELLKILKTIKGKFLLSLADIDIKKKEFQPFKIISVPTKYVGVKTKGGQSQKVKEYLIMNYEPRMKGGYCGGCSGLCGGAVSDFQLKLEKIGLKPMNYLKQAKLMADKTGYDGDKVLFCNTGKNKLMYESPDGLVHFGNPDYPDYIIYSWLEHIGQVEEGYADKRRELYRARATRIKGNWKKNKYSKNNMSINILW
jgi:DNA adenine methylase